MDTQQVEVNLADKAGDLAKNIWLAGLGAYGKAFDQAQDSFDRVSKESSRLFEDLVHKGEKLEDSTQSRLSLAKNKSSETLEERISKVKGVLGFGIQHKGESIAELNAKVDMLSAKVDKLVEALAAKA